MRAKYRTGIGRDREVFSAGVLNNGPQMDNAEPSLSPCARSPRALASSTTTVPACPHPNRWIRSAAHPQTVVRWSSRSKRSGRVRCVINWRDVGGGVSERKSEGERGVHVYDGDSMSGTLRASEREGQR